MYPPTNPESLAALEDASSLVLSLDPQATAIVMATSVLASAAAAATSTLTSAVSTASQVAALDEEPGECELLGPFAILVQIALGALALSSLVFKRWRERPQRPLKIWFFDVSKQVVGSVLVHIANVFMSMLTSGHFSVQVEPVVTTGRLLVRSDDEYTPNPCSSYLLNLAIDTTLGIPILILLLRIFTGLARFTPLGQPSESVQSGNYGSPPKALWWLKQSFIYFCGLFGMKVCVLIIFLMMPWISKIGDWALGWTEGNEKLQIAFVMMIFPLVMNALQYYIIDSLIMMKETDPDSQSDNQGEGGSGRYDDIEDETARARLVDSHDSESESDQETIKPTPRPQSKDSAVYDPDVDGDDQTVVASSAGARHEQSKVISPKLFPKE